MTSKAAAEEKEEVRYSSKGPLTLNLLTIDSQRLKSALWYALGNYVDEECLAQNLNATPQFIAALTELVWTQIGAHTL